MLNIDQPARHFHSVSWSTKRTDLENGRFFRNLHTVSVEHAIWTCMRCSTEAGARWLTSQVTF